MAEQFPRLSAATLAAANQVGAWLAQDDLATLPALPQVDVVVLAGNAVIRHLPGVAHYDFLSECTPLGADRLQGLCRTAVPKAATHAAAVDDAQVQAAIDVLGRAR